MRILEDKSVAFGFPNQREEYLVWIAIPTWFPGSDVNLSHHTECVCGRVHTEIPMT